MNRSQFVAGLMTFAAVTLSCTTVPAFFHLWKFTEFFSNADGTVQFIELHSSGPAETLATGAEFRSLSTGKLVTLSQNLTGSTQDRKLLLATPNFATLPGSVPPDFEIPVNFFNPAGDTVSLFHHQPIDSRTFTSIPTDGVFSRVYPQDQNQFNSPTNFLGQEGRLNLNILPGDYNDNDVVDAADYVVWRENVDTTNTIPNDTTPEWVMQEDYDVWRAFFGQTAGNGAALGSTVSAKVPEPATSGLLLMGTLLFLMRRLTRVQ